MKPSNLIKPSALSMSILCCLSGVSYADSTSRDATMNVYGVVLEDSEDETYSGLGVGFESEKFKISIESTSNDALLAETSLTFNPNNSQLYLKVGAGYLEQEFSGFTSRPLEVNAVSAMFATGYMLDSELYIEAGLSSTRLDADTYSEINGYGNQVETITSYSGAVTKRVEVSAGTLDLSLDVGQFSYESDDARFYGICLDFYPTNSTKLTFGHVNLEDSVTNNIEIQHGYFFVNYANDTSSETYEAEAGLKVAFGDMFNPSSYKAPMNIKRHLSE